MKKELFGQYEGKNIYRYTLDNGILSMSILNWGCVIQKLIFDGVDVECGFDSGVILEHRLKVNADRMSEKDNVCRPTGIIYEVKGSVLDLSDGPKIKERIDSPHPQLQMFGGYGHNYIISDDAPSINYKGRELKEHCVYSSDKRSLSIYSDKPCIQVYTANLIGGHAPFKNNTEVIRRSAVALEPQYEPNACNEGKYILHVGEKYEHVSLYRFEKK